ncbi:sulfite exporter TauE/SafE family protein [Endozoicomonas elysicola]|uniref:Probable membrane transporter protein n=1 Tax=Endozoicomonas elysicola TaxID=305900 RepID=A0A081K7N8_9GAMM|nr:sulfite exporter TauE/SafE family protein [Endozoicomonas elysicola]KEI70164.1 hypothetical protein GV64_04865 [Endozoicomonas elysicola]
MAMELMIIGLLLILMAGTVHGALGFGFPMLSTPVLALAYDLKTAVLLTMIPSLVVITLSLCNCRNIKGTVRQYGLIIIVTTLGSLLGAWALTWANPDLLKLLLAASIFIYLFSSSIKKYFSALSDHPILFPIVMGSFAGMIGGATNAVAPILMIYLLEVTKSSKEIIIVSNICFLLSKFMQLIILSTHLAPDEIELIPLTLITVVACAGLFAGFRLQTRINAERYRVIIRYVLSVFMCVLTYQGLTSLSLTL